MLALAVASLALAPCAAEDDVDSLLAALRKGAWSKRVEAHLALAELGAEALPALADAHEAARSENIDALQSLIGAARLRIAIADPSAVPTLLAQLADERPNVNVVAQQSLALSPFVDVERLSALVEADDPPTRRRALEALALLGGDARDALPVIRDALRDDPDTDVRTAAAMALGALRARDEETLEALVLATRSEQRGLSGTAGWAFARLGEAGLPQLLEALETPWSAGPASVALARLGDVGVEAAAGLLAHTESDHARHAALHVLAHAGRREESLAEVVFPLAEVDEDEVRIAALLALPAVAPADEAVPFLRTALRAEDWQVRAAAARAARRYGPDTVRELAGDIGRAWDASWADERKGGPALDALLMVAESSGAVTEIALDHMLDDPQRFGSAGGVLLQARSGRGRPAGSSRSWRMPARRRSVRC